MAHFAQLDNNSVVVQIVVVHNNELLDEHGNEIEQKGINFCKSLFGQDTQWVQTSYNAKFRKNYACGGATYNKELDAFIHPTPYPSWVLDETTCKWQAPVLYPTDGLLYSWDELTQTWTIG